MAELYRSLGVTRTASHEQIKSAFRKLAKKCHPDLHAGDRRAEQRFKEINLAYETLGNPERRALYDAACMQARIRARQHFRRAAATMCASFLLTVSSGVSMGVWFFGDGLF